MVSTQYRYAPGHPFPAAIDDIDDVFKWLVRNAEREFGADPKLLTISGLSAGGNLALAVCQQKEFHGDSETAIKGMVAYYASVSWESVYCAICRALVVVACFSLWENAKSISAIIYERMRSAPSKERWENGTACLGVLIMLIYQ